MGKSRQKVYDTNKLADLILTLTALSGEFPMSQINRLPSTTAYREKVLKFLKAEKLLHTYYRNGLRGLRLTAKAKKLLAANQPDHFSSLFAGDTATSTPKYTLVHRLRLHRMAEVLVTMFHAGVSVLGQRTVCCTRPTTPRPIRCWRPIC